MALSSHQSARMGTDEWLTPPEILAALGPFDLDPCTPDVMPWPTAAKRYTKAQDGLCQHWKGRVWLNPPFGREAALWLAKLARHGDGIALVPARTETRMFYESVWHKADAVCFMRGRPHFHRVDGTRASANSGAPLALVAYGRANVDRLREANLGIVVDAMKERSGSNVAERDGGTSERDAGVSTPQQVALSPPQIDGDGK